MKAVKSHLFILILLTFLPPKLFAQIRLHVFTLSGKIRGLDTGYVFLNYLKSDGNGIYDSCYLNDGVFLFKGFITEPSKAFFTTSNLSGSNDTSNFIDFYIEPTNMTLNIDQNNFQNFTLIGSPSQDEYSQLLDSEASTRTKISKYEAEFNYIYSKEHGSDSLAIIRRIDSVKNILTELRNKINDQDSDFIARNNNSYVSAELLSHAKVDWLSFRSFKALYGTFTKRIQQSIPGKRIIHEIEKEESTPIGGRAKDFTAIDSRGDTVRLSNFKGKKIVLLDFGASWCVPCVNIIPYLKKDYEKYNASLEIISINQEDNKGKWKDFLKKEAMNWPQIIDNKSNYPISPRDQTITNLYHIDLIPALILIDRRSKIAAKYGSFYFSPRAYLPALDKKIKSILKY